jgi:hypothetical protein
MGGWGVENPKPDTFFSPPYGGLGGKSYPHFSRNSTTLETIPEEPVYKGERW